MIIDSCVMISNGNSMKNKIGYNMQIFEIFQWFLSVESGGNTIEVSVIRAQ